MPYRRRTYSKKRSFRRRRSTYTTTGSALHLARQAARGVYYLKGLVNSELFKSNIATSGTLSTTGTVVPLTDIQVGDQDFERTGKSIFVRSSDLRLKLFRDPAVGADTQLVRIALVMDKQQISDTAPSYTDIYNSSGPLAHLNDNSAGRYRIMWSRVYALDKIDKVVRYIGWFKKMRHHVRYNGNNSTDIQKGGLYLVMSSDQTTSGFPSYSLNHRLSYHDN